MIFKDKKYMHTDKWLFENKNAEMKRFVMNDIWLEAPLLYNNKSVTLRFDLQSVVKYSEKRKIIVKIFSELFKNSDEIQLCFLGTIGINPKLVKKFTKHNINKENCIEFKAKSEDLLYGYDNLTYLTLEKKNLKLDTIIKDICREPLGFLSFFLVDVFNKVAFQLYDYRGIDICILDKSRRKIFYDQFSNYIIEYDRKMILENL